jgi:hypothetical protein
LKSIMRHLDDVTAGRNAVHHEVAISVGHRFLREGGTVRLHRDRCCRYPGGLGVRYRAMHGAKDLGTCDRGGQDDEQASSSAQCSPCIHAVSSPWCSRSMS